MTLDPGFRPDGVIVVDLGMRRANVPIENRRTLINTIIERMKTAPGIDGGAETFIAPMSGSGWNDRIVLDDKPQEGVVNFNGVGPGYFRTLGTRFVKGREFTEHDTASSPRVAVVNELFVSRYLAGKDPLGHVLYVQQGPGQPPASRLQIVGVVADTKYRNLREPLTPIAYVSVDQEANDDPDINLVLHSRIEPASVTPALTQILREINPAMTVRYQTMPAMVKGTLTSERLMATLSGFFGGLAVLIATIGLYGVMSYMVARRRMEIGIRMALGADASAVVRMVVADAARLLTIGLFLGLALSIAGAKSAGALLYGLSPWDPVSLALAAGALGAVALVASWWPANRAARVSPTVALRQS
jgi:predicted permease